MSDAYDRQYRKGIGCRYGYRVFEGVYAGYWSCLETLLNKYLRIIGADTVGMSTVPEVIVARAFLFAISVITDLGVPENQKVGS